MVVLISRRMVDFRIYTHKWFQVVAYLAPFKVLLLTFKALYGFSLGLPLIYGNESVQLLRSAGGTQENTSCLGHM